MQDDFALYLGNPVTNLLHGDYEKNSLRSSALATRHNHERKGSMDVSENLNSWILVHLADLEIRSQRFREHAAVVLDKMRTIRHVGSKAFG